MFTHVCSYHRMLTLLTLVVGTNAIRRHGNKLVDDAGATVRLKGVGYMGTEYECVSESGRIFSGPADAKIITAWKSWGINAVRLPMNEDCWLGINGAPVAATAYRAALVNFTTLAATSGITVILDLHWTSTNASLAKAQEPMMSSTSLQFWEDLATEPALRHSGIVFELFNEPFGFEAWRNASERLEPPCFVNGTGCVYAGYQQGVDVVRAAGWKGLILIGTDDWSFDLDFVVANPPTDPLDNLALSWHPYEFKKGPPSCAAWGCHGLGDAAMAAGWPVVMTEFGPEDDSSRPNMSYVDGVYEWARRSDVSGMLAWVWMPGHGHLRLLAPDSDFYGSEASVWGRSWKQFSF